MNISIKLPDNVVDYFLLKTLLFLNEEEKASGQTLEQMDWKVLKRKFKDYLDAQACAD